MLEQINRLFRITPFTPGTSSFDKISYIEHIYQNALDYIYENVEDKNMRHHLCDYAFVQFSNLIGHYATVAEYADYIDQKMMIDNINNYVQESRYQGPKL